MDNAYNMLSEEIKQRLEDLSNSERLADPEKDKQAVDNLAVLYRLMLEDDKVANEHSENVARIDSENDSAVLEKRKFDHQKESKKIEYVIAAAEIGLPLIFYGVWLKRGFKFEETGAFTSGTFRSLWSRFKPTKK